jgi:hypothetical protein
MTTSELVNLLPDVKMRPPLPVNEADELIADFVAEVGPIPHADYLAFMREHNGCDGLVGREGNISLWPLEEVLLRTEQYRVDEFAPGLLLIGSDGGNEAFAFDRRGVGWPIVSVPLVVMSRAEMKFVAPTFSGFVRRLAADELPI